MDTFARGFVRVCVAFFATTPACLRADGDEKPAIVNAWEAATQSVPFVRWEYRRERASTKKGEKSVRRRIDQVKIAYSSAGVKSDADTAYLDEQGTITEQHRQLILTNAKYKATLQRAKGKDDWLLTEYEEFDPTKELDPRRMIGCPWLECGNIFLPNWVADDCFVITRVENLSGPDTGKRRVHFVHDEARRKNLKKNVPINAQSGYIDIEPAEHYRVTSFRFKIKTRFSEGFDFGSLTYEPGGEVPVLKETTEDEQTDSERFGSIQSQTVSTYQIDYRNKASDEEFRLSHYGLPEPVGVEWKKPTPRYIWLLAGAAVFGLLALGARYLARRKRVAAT